MSTIVEKGFGVGDVISLLWFKRSLPRYCTQFIEVDAFDFSFTVNKKKYWAGLSNLLSSDIHNAMRWSWSLRFWRPQYNCDCTCWKGPGFQPCSRFAVTFHDGSSYNLNLRGLKSFKYFSCERTAHDWPTIWRGNWWCCPILQGCSWQSESLSLSHIFYVFS